MKNKVTAGILGILLGSFGVHKFYLGKIGMGILYLVFCWTGIPGIVGLIEGILYLTKSQEAFDAEFNGGRNSDAGVGSANAETLERLAALRQRGDITEEEYSEKKSDLLKRIEGGIRTRLSKASRTACRGYVDCSNGVIRQIGAQAVRRRRRVAHRQAPYSRKRDICC